MAANGQESLVANVLVSQIRNSQSWTFPVLHEAANPNRSCFSIFGNVKADGTPFVEADCPNTVPMGPVTTVLFSVTR